MPVSSPLSRTVALAVAAFVAVTTASAQDKFECREPVTDLIAYRIKGGRFLLPPWPYIVSLKRIQDREQFCGGSLVSEDWVLTAAHCATAVFVSGPQDLFVQRSDGGGYAGGESARVTAMFVHPDYRASTTSLVNDIALLKLKRRMDIESSDLAFVPTRSTESQYMKPAVCSAVAGWGLTQSGGNPSERLLRAEVRVIGTRTCNEGYNGAIKEQEHVCAGYPSGGPDSCQGDSGGPLILRAGPTGVLQIGVVSYGEGCGKSGKPGVYTRVSTYRDWIYDTIARN